MTNHKITKSKTHSTKSINTTDPNLTNSNKPNIIHQKLKHYNGTYQELIELNNMYQNTLTEDGDHQNCNDGSTFNSLETTSEGQETVIHYNSHNYYHHSKLPYIIDPKNDTYTSQYSDSILFEEYNPSNINNNNFSSQDVKPNIINNDNMPFNSFDDEITNDDILYKQADIDSMNNTNISYHQKNISEAITYNIPEINNDCNSVIIYKDSIINDDDNSSNHQYKPSEVLIDEISQKTNAYSPSINSNEQIPLVLKEETLEFNTSKSESINNKLSVTNEAAQTDSKNQNFDKLLLEHYQSMKTLLEKEYGGKEYPLETFKIHLDSYTLRELRKTNADMQKKYFLLEKNYRTYTFKKRALDHKIMNHVKKSSKNLKLFWDQYQKIEFNLNNYKDDWKRARIQTAIKLGIIEKRLSASTETYIKILEEKVLLGKGINQKELDLWNEDSSYCKKEYEQYIKAQKTLDQFTKTEEEISFIALKKEFEANKILARGYYDKKEDLLLYL